MDLRKVVCVLSLCAANVAFATDIPIINLTPSELTIPVTATVQVSAKVAPDPTHPLIPNSVSLLETDIGGATLAIIGQMYDDGSRGDLAAGDFVYSFQIPISQSTPGIRYFRVSAAYSGVRNRVISEVTKLMIIPSLDPAAIDAATTSIQTLQAAFNSNVASRGLPGAIALILDMAAADPQIGPGNVSFEEENRTVVVDYQVVDPTTGFVIKILGVIRVDDPAIQGQVDGAGTSWPRSFPANYESPSNDKVLLFAPGYSTPGDRQNQVAEEASNAFDFAAFMDFKPNPLSITADSAASLENIKTWGQFSTIIVHTHGLVVSRGFASPQVGLTTGTPSSARSGTILADLAARRIGITASGRFFILPGYIRQYVTPVPRAANGLPPLSFVYLGACESAKNNSMINAFLAAGAGAVIGWNQEVTRSFNASYVAALLGRMLPSDPAAPPLTLQQTFDSTPGHDNVGVGGFLGIGAVHADAVLTYVNRGGNFTYALHPLQLAVSGTSPFGLPASIQLSTIYRVPVARFQVVGDAGNNCSNTGERGGPIFSASVAAGSDFFGSSTVSGFPNPPSSGPPINRRPCSSFIATTTDSNGNAKVWVSATGHGFSNNGLFISDWEYQVRYFSGTPPLYADKSCTIGTIPNSNNYAPAANVTCSLSCNGALFGKLLVNTPGQACTGH